MRRILVIEDERDIAELVALHLADLPAQVTLAHDGPGGLRLALQSAWDAIVLDLRLPGLNGLDLCRELRAQAAQVPVLMLTARSSELDRVLGLELGADDYLAKPFSVLELQARVKALLRRSALTAAHRAAQADARPTQVVQGRLSVDRVQRRAWLDGAEIVLTPREFDLLWHFVQHPGRVFTRAELLADVWGHGHDGYDHTVNSHINRLRSKLGDEREQAAFIHTVWGVGYRFEVAAMTAAAAPGSTVPPAGTGPATPWRGPLWRRLHVRAALLAAPLLLGLGAAMFLLLQHYSAQTALEAGQRMNLGLARYVVDHQPPGLIAADGRPDAERMKALAVHVMTINPAVELYLLDAEGRVIAHALEGLQGPGPVGVPVSLGPVRRLLEAESDARVRLPVLGTDPRQPERANSFSVAAVNQPGGGMGYLYIVLDGSRSRGVTASLENSDALRAMAIGAGLATLLTLGVLWLAWQQLTRPLRQLTDEARSFRGEAAVPGQGPAGDEIALLRQALRAQQQRIALQFQRLEDGDRQRRELVSNISHDLRTPLSSIQGYVETVLLRGDALDAEARATHLRTALRQAERLGQRIADLFELSKLDAGRIEPRHEVFCLAELLQDVVQAYRLAAQQRGVSIHLAAGSQAQARVSADIALIERVLQNLVDNALRCTAAGGAVVLALEHHGAFLQISVSDTGHGIAHEHLPHIFERYWRASEPGEAGAGDGSGSSSSSGLGLAIVKRILDLHGSVVRVQSEIQRGTRFEFLLPRAT